MGIKVSGTAASSRLRVMTLHRNAQQTQFGYIDLKNSLQNHKSENNWRLTLVFNKFIAIYCVASKNYTNSCKLAISGRLLRQPLPHGIVHPRLPAFARSAQACQHIGIKTDGGGDFGVFKRRATAGTTQFVPRFKKLGRHDLTGRAGALEPIGIQLARIRVGGNPRVDLGVFFGVRPMNNTT